MIEDYSRNNGILPLLAIVVCAAIMIFIDGGWMLPILLFVIFCVYHLVISPASAKSNYKKRRKAYDNKIKNLKPYVSDSLTSESKQKIYDDYKYNPQNLFHNTKDGYTLFYNLKKRYGYPQGAIPDPDNYETDYVVGNVIELTNKNPNHMQYNIEYKGLVYELDGSYYKAECFGRRTATLENVKKYGYGGTEVYHILSTWKTNDQLKEQEILRRIKKNARKR